MKKNIIIVILSLCIVAGVFYFVKNNGNKPNDNDGNKVNKIYSDQEYVIDGPKYYPDVDNKSVYTYLSMVNLDSDYAKEVNDSISKDVLYKNYEGNMNVTYEWHENDGILSIVVRVRGAAQEGRLDVWHNIDINTGKKVELTEVLKRKNISLDDFNKKVNAILTNYANKCYENSGFTGGFTKLEDGTIVDNSLTKDEFIKKSINDLPSTNEIPFYLDEKGNINFVVSLISCGGPVGMWTYQFNLNDDLEEITKTKNYLNVYRAGDGVFSTDSTSGSLIFAIETETNSAKLFDVDVRNGINVLYNDNGLKIYNVAKKTITKLSLKNEYDFYKLYKNSSIITLKDDKAGYYDISNNKMMFENKYSNMFFVNDSYVSGFSYGKSKNTADLINVKTGEIELSVDEVYFINVEESNGKKYYIAEQPGNEIVSIYSGLKKVVYTASNNSYANIYNGYLYVVSNNRVTKFDNDGKEIKSLTYSDLKRVVNNYAIYLDNGYLKVINIDDEKELFKIEWSNNYKFVSSYYKTQEEITEERIVNGTAGLYVELQFVNPIKESDRSQVGISYIYSVNGHLVKEAKYNYNNTADVTGLVKEYIANNYFFHGGKDDNEKSFGAIKVYLQERKGNDIVLYTYVLKENLSVENNKIVEGGSMTFPAKFVVRKVNNSYEVVEIKYPRSGVNYGNDIKTIFPESVRNEINNFQTSGVLKELENDIMNQAEKFYGISSENVDVESLIKEYVASHYFDNAVKDEKNKSFGSVKVYLQERDNNGINVYAYVLKSDYCLLNNVIQLSSAMSFPAKFVIKKVNNSYAVTEIKYPRSGVDYGNDIKTIFPESVRKEIEKVQTSGVIKELENDSIKQVEKHYGIPYGKNGIKVNADKPYVYDGDKYYPTIYNNSGKKVYIPYININSDYVKSLNNTLASNSFLTTGNEILTADYEWFINRNILSVVVRKRTSATEGKLDFWVNIDVNTGKKVELSDVLKSKNISNDKFYTKFENAVYGYLKGCGQTENKKYEYPLKDYTSAFYTPSEFVAKAKSDLPTINQIPFYLDNSGNIKIVASMLSCSGATGMWTYELDLEEK